MSPTTKTINLANLVTQMTIEGKHGEVKAIIDTASRSVKPVLQDAIKNAHITKKRQDIRKLLAVGNHSAAWALAETDEQSHLIIYKWLLDLKVNEVVPEIVARFQQETDYTYKYDNFGEIDVRDEKNGIRFYLTCPRSSDMVSCYSKGKIGNSDLIDWDKMAAFTDMARIVYKLQDEIGTALFAAMSPLVAYEENRRWAENAQKPV